MPVAGLVSVMKYLLHSEWEHTASSDEKSLAPCVELALRWRDAVVGFAVVGLDLDRPDLWHVLETVGLVGVWLCHLGGS
jgi:hypothetical protein